MDFMNARFQNCQFDQSLESMVNLQRIGKNDKSDVKVSKKIISETILRKVPVTFALLTDFLFLCFYICN